MSIISLLTRKKCVLLAVLVVVTLVSVSVSHMNMHKPRVQKSLLGSLATESSLLRISSEQHSQSRMPLVGEYGCQDSVCSELLSEEEKTMFEQCSQTLGEREWPRINRPDAEKCHFINSTGRAAVALSSFPGSGNTWVRGLLEKATGICTGAIYCGDVSQVFPGEGVTTGAVLVVKTHAKRINQKKSIYGAAIHLVRNPFGALVAEYNREKSNQFIPGDRHISSVGKERFGNYSEWEDFLQLKTERWKVRLINWTQKQLEILIFHVRYEDIKKDRVREVKRMLEFLGVPYSEEELRERLSEDFDLFHRSMHEDFDPYTPEQRQYVNQQIREAVDTVRTNNNGDALGFEMYLT